MDANTLYTQFEVMFPEYAKHAKKIKPIGHSAISIDFGDWSYSRVFLYINDNNWHFGTKLWRKRPERISNNEFTVNENAVYLPVQPMDDVNPSELGLFEGEDVDAENIMYKTTTDTFFVDDKTYYVKVDKA